jgi:S-adenosylmethionine decarboxylase
MKKKMNKIVFDDGGQFKIDTHFSFGQMKFEVGTHFIVEAIECDLDILSDATYLLQSFKTCIDRAEMTLLDSSYHEFEPQGATVLALLSESHLSIHTYPEHNGYASIDLYTCGDSEKAYDGLIYLMTMIQAKDYRITKIKRGF